MPRRERKGRQLFLPTSLSYNQTGLFFFLSFVFFFFASWARGGGGRGRGLEAHLYNSPKLRVICPPKLQRIMYSSFSTSWHSLIDTMTQSVHLSRGNELWEEIATDRTIGIPIFESVRRKTPPGEVGGAKLLSHFL